jgi:hypothetical protein
VIMTTASRPRASDGVDATAASPTRRDVVRNSSKSKNRPPTSSGDGDESPRRREGLRGRCVSAMPVLKTTSPGRFTFAPKEVPSSRWPSFSTSVAATGASQGLDGPPSTPSMRDLCCFAVSHVCVPRCSGARRRRGRAARGRCGRSAARAASGRRARALVSKTPAPHELEAYR